MKKNLLIIAAIATATLVSCSSEEFAGGELVSTPENESPAIVFNSRTGAITRADYVGADAASMLNNKFIVSTFKGNGTTMATSMPDYVVQYVLNTAGTTESNTSDWEYVGITALAPSVIAGNKQTIKFWDYSQDQYDFIAYSTGNATVITSGTPQPASEVLVTAIEPNSPYGPTYTLKGSTGPLSKCYIADMITAYKDGSDANHKYQDEVTFKFRNLTTKVRVALYETVPGYSVKDVQFYTDATTNLDADISANTDVTLFTTGTATKDNFYNRGTYTVSFPTIGKGNIDNSDYNKAHVSFAPVSTGTSTTQAFGALKYGAAEASEAAGNYYLGRTLPFASYAGNAADNYYTIILPNEEGTVLELRINYTLLATDGSGEEIKVYGATAYVPAIYAAWKPNYAYTYVFKISDNTNGWTNTANAAQNTVDPSGLYPITFDAVVIDAEEFTQSTITSVSTPSITTYQKGHDVTKDEYAAGDIYVQVMRDGALITDLNTVKTKLYKVTDRSGLTVTEADVMDALNIQESSTTTAITGRNGWELTNAPITVDATTIPGVDGNDITVTAGEAAKFAATAGTYAFVYDYTGGVPAKTNLYSAQDLTTEPTGWPTGYFIDPDGKTAASGAFSAGIYYKKYENLNHTIAVKIIKVQ